VTKAALYSLYIVFTLGGASLYFLLPRAEGSRRVAGLVFAASTVAGFLTLLTATSIPAPVAGWYFYLFAGIAILASVRVVSHPKPVFSALYFVLVVIAVAALLVLQQAEFLAIALVIVYAGAILVTYLFVIMLAQQAGSPAYDRRAREPFLAVLVGFVVMGALAARAAESPRHRSALDRGAVRTAAMERPAAPVPLGNTADLGAMLMTKFVAVLEIAGILLLVSMVGAIALSRKQVASEELRTPHRPLGRIGKEVRPF
jgi:NADH-quinone oxidoreductase subunit J